VEVAPHIFNLGSARDPKHGDVVEGYLIVHYKKGYGKPSGTPGKGNKDSDSSKSSCYAFLAKDAKWKSIEPWVVNPSNASGISDASIFSILDKSIVKWEDAAQMEILGQGSITTASLKADMSSMDSVNEIYFDSLNEGTIGVTIVWGVFGGPPKGRELREWDQIYNTAYQWSDSGESSAMDFENIATHELGHSVGLADLYQSECLEETMYGYGTEGETKKRDLNAGDIFGISKLY